MCTATCVEQNNLRTGDERQNRTLPHSRQRLREWELTARLKVALGMRCSREGRESKARKNDKRRRGKALIKQRVGAGMPEMPAEMEEKAGVWRTL